MDKILRERTIFLASGFVIGLVLFFILNQFLLAPVTAVFSPENGDEVIRFIDGAENSLDIEVYLFTSNDVYYALERAQERGVKIRVLLEAEPMDNANDAVYHKLAAAGIPVKLYSGERLHAKFIIRDGREVLVGSHNFSYSALNKNREASVIVSGSVVQEFVDIFEGDWLWASPAPL